MEPTTLTEQQLITKWWDVLAEAHSIFTWTSPGELAFLCECASKATNIVEIGSFHGKSALVMALANPAAHITAIDNCENPEVEEVFAYNLRRQIAVGQVKFVRGTSDLLRIEPLAIMLKGKVDLTFIDGGHLAPDLISDITNLKPLLKPGALLAGHDWRTNMGDGVNVGVVKCIGMPQGVFESIWHKVMP